MAGTPKIDEVRDHLLALVEKATDIAEVHGPKILEWVEAVARNPMVTAIASAIPGELSPDAMTVLNGLFPMLAGLGAHYSVTPPADPPVPAQAVPPLDGPPMPPVPPPAPPAPLAPPDETVGLPEGSG